MFQVPLVLYVFPKEEWGKGEVVWPVRKKITETPLNEFLDIILC